MKIKDIDLDVPIKLMFWLLFLLRPRHGNVLMNSILKLM